MPNQHLEKNQTTDATKVNQSGVSQSEVSQTNPSQTDVNNNVVDDFDSSTTSRSQDYDAKRSNIDDITPAYATVTPSLLKRPKLIPNRGAAALWYLLSLLIVGLDQWTKWIAETTLTLHEPNAVIEPVLNWTLAYNYGAAWSILADQGGWQKWFFAAISLVMSLFLIFYLTKTPRQAKFLNTGLALILGGAIGNLIDRIRLGKVVDFIHVHYADVWNYPIFNVADMAICIGVVLVLIDTLFLESKRNSRYQSA